MTGQYPPGSSGNPDQHQPPFAAYPHYGRPQPPVIYGQPQPLVVHTETNSFATASLVLGIIGLFTAGITSMVGLVFGILGLTVRKVNHSTAIAGIVTSGIVVAGWIVFWVLVFAGAIAGGASS